MTTFRSSGLWTLLIGVAAALAGYWVYDQRKMSDHLDFARSSAELCGFPEDLVKFGQGRPRQIALGGQELDCETGRKNRALQCVENKLTSEKIVFQGPGYRGNCTYVPPVP